MLRRIANKNLHTWLGGYARHLGRLALGRRSERPSHLLFAVCDHYEPLWGKTTPLDVGDARVEAWENRYPILAEQFRDADGLPPRHSFFFPGEEYDPRFLERLARLAAAGYGEVELHLHHDGDTADALRQDIATHLDNFAQHGHLSRETTPSGERYRFAFIHGNWCLANARKDGRWCGVDEEVQLLFDAGCYADFTFPSAPDECQPNLVNQIYWPTGDLRRRKAYATGDAARVGQVLRDRLLMVTGPLALTRRPGTKLRFRIESSALSHDDPPSAARVRSWIAQNIHIQGRPEWLFVKVHTHGAPEDNANVMLGDAALSMHHELARIARQSGMVLHYVTAREMYNIAMAAMEGGSGDPAQYRDHIIAPPPVATQRRGVA